MPAENFVITNLVLCDVVARNGENFGMLQVLACLGAITSPLKARQAIAAEVTCEVVACSMVSSFLCERVFAAETAAPDVARGLIPVEMASSLICLTRGRSR